MKAKIEAYKEILKVVKKHSEIFEEDRFIEQASNIESVILSLEISDRFGIPLQYLGQLGNSYSVKNAYDEWTRIALHGKDSISYSDDGRQPDNEWLFRICFTTGAYTFGQSYPTQTFNAFWQELKGYLPKYIDTANHCMYFTEHTAKFVYDDFWGIFKKYEALVGEELKEKRKLELEAELAKLKGE